MFNPLSLIGKRILVTGAASGIGRETSILLSKLGAEVILIDQNEEGLIRTDQSCESKSYCLVINLTNFSEIKMKILEFAKNYGKISGIVHCAGISYISPLKTITETKYLEVLRINTFAALELSKVFSDKNVRMGVNDSIVFISSIYGCVGSSANVGYSMSKFALHGITKSLAIELASKKIRVNCIAPGFVKTNMLESVNGRFADSDYVENLTKLHPLGLGNPIEIANLVSFLQSEMATWMTGSIINLDGGYTAQ